jgi:hypothetical protein
MYLAEFLLVLFALLSGISLLYFGAYRINAWKERHHTKRFVST